MSHGRFVWHDLMSTDVAKSRQFFQELFGWKIDEMDMGGGNKYLHIKAGEKGQGGILPVGRPGMPSQWIGYVDTNDIEAAHRNVLEHGGKVHVPTVDMPNVGKFFIAADPHGAVFAPFQTANPMPDSDAKPAPGEFCWDELMTTDPEAAAKFYHHAVGWTHHGVDMGPMGTYNLFRHASSGDKDVGGMMKQPAQAAAMGPPSWTAYVAVADTDAAVARIQELGGKVFMPGTDIPNVGRFAVGADPTGAVFAVLGPNTGAAS